MHKEQQTSAPDIFKPKSALRDRLDFNSIERLSPELATRTKVLRNRVVELENNFFSDSRWALRWFKGMAAVAIALPIIAAAVGGFTAIQLNGAAGIATFATISVLAALGSMAVASLHAFGWHKRYNAMFSARWKMTALRTRIDQYIATLAFEINEQGTMIPEMRARLSESVDSWLDEFRGALHEFGIQYGNSLSPPSAKSNNQG